LRERIIKARPDSGGTGEVCECFRASRKSVERFWNQHRAGRHCLLKQIGSSRKSRLKYHEKRLQRWIAQQPDLTMLVVQQRCQAKFYVQIGLTRTVASA
jgi:transposase